jgi:cytochrome c
MTSPRLAVLAAAMLVAATPVLAADPPNAYGMCAACHTGQPGALGPNLTGVVGRAAGSVEGFHYSGPMKRSHIVWTQATLVRYLEHPQDVVPGNRMPLDGISASDANAIVKYLVTLK